MIALQPKPVITRPYPARERRKGAALVDYLGTTDHKTIGQLYMVTTFIFFIIGGGMAMLMILGMTMSLCFWVLIGPSI